MMGGPVEAQVVDDVGLMRCALRLGRRAARRGEVPVGAVVSRREASGRQVVIAGAHNLAEARGDLTCHAELLALRRAARRLGQSRLTGCTLTVTLEPCLMCLGALLLARIERLIFAARCPPHEAVGARGALPYLAAVDSPVQVVAGLLAEPAGALLQAFFAARRASPPA